MGGSMKATRGTKSGRGRVRSPPCGGGDKNRTASSNKASRRTSRSVVRGSPRRFSLTFLLRVVSFLLAVKNRELASFRRTVPLRSGPHIRRLNPQVRKTEVVGTRAYSEHVRQAVRRSLCGGNPYAVVLPLHQIRSTLPCAYLGP